MQRRQQQVTSQGRSNGDVCRFTVTDFTDEDDVRVLTKNRAKTSGKRQATFGIHRHLIDPGQFIFDRIFNRDDFFTWVVQLRETRVERGGLTRTGRSRDQYHAVWLGDHSVHGVSVVLGHAQALEIKGK